MQVSINASEVLLREPVRMDLERKVKEFLKQKSVNEVEQGLGSKENKFVFNDSISLAPTRRTAAAAEKEALHAAIAISHRNRWRNANQVGLRSVCPTTQAWVQSIVAVG
jgi:hypothetical protein